MRSRNVLTMLAPILLVGLSGCEKIPTWSELTNGPQPAPAPAPTVQRVETIQPAPVAKPVETPPEEIIAKFKALKPHEISDMALGHLLTLNKGLEEVTEINADGSGLTSKAFGSIEKLTNLRQLRLCGSRIDNSVGEKIALLTSLEVLAISDTGVSDVGIAAISSLPNLKHLEINRCVMGDNGFHAVGLLPALDSLYIEATGLNNPRLDMVCNSKTLKTLWLTRNQVDDFGLAALRKLNGLEVLEINYNGVSGEGLRLAMKGEGLKSLKVLGLYACPITEPGVKAIGAVKSVERLNLGETIVNDVALNYMITNLKNLKHLNLNKCNNINGEGLLALKGCKQFEDLYITQCPNVGDGVIPVLKTIKTLKIFSSQGSGVTPNGLAALKAAIPDLKTN